MKIDVKTGNLMIKSGESLPEHLKGHYTLYSKKAGNLFFTPSRGYSPPFVKTPESYNEGDPIFSSPFVFLEHFTDEKNMENIIQTGALLTDIELSKRGTDFVHGICGSETKHCSAKRLGDYPGIYMSIRTQSYFLNIIDGIQETVMEQTRPIFIFSLALLQQKNYHYNTGDLYGSIIDKTFSPSNLFKYLNKMSIFYTTRPNNSEVVFHDSISLEFCEMILVRDRDMRDNILKILKKSKWKHIRVEVLSYEIALEMVGFQYVKHLNNYEILDDSEPQYCYTNVKDDFRTYDMKGNYYSYKMLHGGSEEDEEYMWNVTLANCGIKEKYDPKNQQKYYDLIEEKMQDIYFGSGERAKVVEEPPFKFGEI